MKKYLLYIFFFLLPLAFIFYPLLKFQEGKLWYTNYYFYDYFNSLSRISPFYVWRNAIGESYLPYLFNIFFTWPINLFIFLTGNAFISLLIYIWFIMVIGIFSFALFIKTLFNNKLNTIVSLLLGVLYVSYFPLHYEAFALKVSAAITPLALWMIMRIYGNFHAKRSYIQSFFMTVCIVLLAINIEIFDARGFLFFLFMCAAQICFSISQKGLKKKVIAIFIGWAVILFTSILLIAEPVQYIWSVFTDYSAQLATQTAESVLTSLFSPFKWALHPRPLYNLPSYGGVIVIAIALVSLIGIAELFKFHKKLAVMVSFLLFFYYVLISRWFLSFATLLLPHGQLFRGWYIAQSFATFIIPLIFAGLFLRRNRYIVCIAMIVLVLYIGLSIRIFTGQMIFMQKSDIQPYIDVNTFLQKDRSVFKVFWTPEMGWFGQNSSPYWIEKSETAQNFPESISAVPTYAHYYDRMTHPYTWLVSGIWESQIETNSQVSKLLNILGVKYLILHDDVEGYHANVERITKHLQSLKNFKLVYRTKYLSVFQNLDFQQRIWATALSSATACDHGLVCLQNYFQKISPYQSTTFLTDMKTDKEVLQYLRTMFVVQGDREEENYYNLLINYFLQNKDLKQNILFSKNYFSDQTVSSCLTDTHHGLYHPYFSPTETFDYANSFDYQNCFFMLSQEQPQIKMIVDNLHADTYVMLVRYFQYDPRQSFLITFDSFTQLVTPREGDRYKNGYVYRTYEVSIPQNDGLNLTLTDEGSTNFISLIAFIPKTVFQTEMQKLKSGVSIVTNSSSVFPQTEEQISAHEINPSEWSVNLVNTHPVILNFAETYNPLWKATIYRDGKQIAEHYSSPGYGMINSFPITEIGKLRIEIIFEPQTIYDRVFYRNLLVSFMVIILSTVALRFVNNKHL